MREEAEFQIILPSCREFVPILTGFLSSLLRCTPDLSDVRDSFFSEVELILAEACTNVVRHAHGESPTKPLKVQAKIEKNCLQLNIFDRGPGFDLKNPALPDDPFALSGRGLFMIRKLSDSMTYEMGENENCLIIRKRLFKDTHPGP